MGRAENDGMTSWPFPCKKDQALSPIKPLGAGDVTGCPALFPPHVHTCTARAITDVNTLPVWRNTPSGAINRQPKAAETRTVRAGRRAAKDISPDPIQKACGRADLKRALCPSIFSKNAEICDNS